MCVIMGQNQTYILDYYGTRAMMEDYCMVTRLPSVFQSIITSNDKNKSVYEDKHIPNISDQINKHKLKKSPAQQH